MKNFVYLHPVSLKPLVTNDEKGPRIVRGYRISKLYAYLRKHPELPRDAVPAEVKDEVIWRDLEASYATPDKAHYIASWDENDDIKWTYVPDDEDGEEDGEENGEDW